VCVVPAIEIAVSRTPAWEMLAASLEAGSPFAPPIPRPGMSDLGGSL